MVTFCGMTADAGLDDESWIVSGFACAALIASVSVAVAPAAIAVSAAENARDGFATVVVQLMLIEAMLAGSVAVIVAVPGPFAVTGIASEVAPGGRSIVAGTVATFAFEERTATVVFAV